VGGSGVNSDGPTFVDREFAGALVVAPATTFERCAFRGVNLQAADLARCRFVECRFVSSNLSVARVPQSAFQETSFHDSKLAGIDWTCVARLTVVSFEKCVLDQCAFLGMDLRKIAMRGCRLRDAVFAEADLAEADLRDADLTGAQFARTTLTKADLRGARGYVIHPLENDVKGMRASMPDAAALVMALGVDVEL
jgi:uncharacterized protein YjbI with pentapeptide repeats